ncbi:hypothetical protein CHS0354_007319, partial [Potamilus streckersoni]
SVENACAPLWTLLFAQSNLYDYTNKADLVAFNKRTIIADPDELVVFYDAIVNFNSAVLDVPSTLSNQSPTLQLYASAVD